MQSESLLTRPEVIRIARSKGMMDGAVRRKELPVIRFGVEGSKRPRYLFRPEDVKSWLEGLTKQEKQ